MFWHVAVSMPSLMGVIGVNEVDARGPLPPRNPSLGHDINSVEGRKGSQIAGRSIGKAWHERREGLESGWVEGLLVVYVCGLSLIVARDNTLAYKE